MTEHGSPRAAAGVLSVFVALALGGCTTTSQVAASTASGRHGSGTTAPAEESPQTGILQVYSATYASTIEQAEYPVHTDYTIETTDDRLVEHVRNLSGPFNAFPARVTLPPGRYHIEAQYDGGKFVVFPLDIAPGAVTMVNLNNETVQPGADPSREPIRLPEGREVGWCTINKQR